MKPKVIIFASGSKDGGGSGFEELVRATQSGILEADIVAVVSNHRNGGVRERADRLKIPFILYVNPREQGYKAIVAETGAEFVLLSGWLKKVHGLDPRTTINIHPGPLPAFGGKGMYGHHVHEAALGAFRRGEIKDSAVTMHFVTEEFDDGPVFFQYPVKIEVDDTPDTLGARVNKFEHAMQPGVTNLVIQGMIHWDGKNPETLTVPEGYPFIKVI